MLRISKQQGLELATSAQERFLRRLAEHLTDCQSTLRLDLAADYDTPEVMARLRKEMHTLLDNGIEHELDIVKAIEYIEIFGADIEAENVSQVLRDQHKSPSEKLDLLWDNRGKQYG